jgi:hypothetical protein
LKNVVPVVEDNERERTFMEQPGAEIPRRAPIPSINRGLSSISRVGTDALVAKVRRDGQVKKIQRDAGRQIIRDAADVAITASKAKAGKAIVNGVNGVGADGLLELQRQYTDVYEALVLEPLAEAHDRMLLKAKDKTEEYVDRATDFGLGRVFGD